jgi:hypothetical protein
VIQDVRGSTERTFNAPTVMTVIASSLRKGDVVDMDGMRYVIV